MITAETLPYGIAPPAFRLPDDTRLGRVRLQVADLSRSLSFYQHVLGLRVLEQGDDWAALGADGTDRPIVELHAKPGTRPVSRRGLLGLYHFAILLPDRGALGRFARHLHDLGVRAGMSDHFVSEAIYLQDPDNLGIEVYADRPRSAWKHSQRELAMTTKPLDLPNLLAAAGDEPWTGAPAGTTLGHVHLHVGGLAEAEAFYHAALGFDKVVWSYPGALFLSAGGYHHHLGTNIWAGDAPRPTAADAQLLEWEIVLPGDAMVADVARSLERAGYSVTREIGGVVTRDPSGTAVRIMTD